MTGQETETRTKTRARTGLLVMQNCHESGKCNYILVDDVDEQPRTEAQSQLQPQLQSQPPSRHFILDRAQYVHINCIMSHRPTLATRNFEANKFSPPLRLGKVSLPVNLPPFTHFLMPLFTRRDGSVVIIEFNSWDDLCRK